MNATKLLAYARSRHAHPQATTYWLCIWPCLIGMRAYKVLILVLTERLIDLVQVIDLGASSPKDYTKACVKKPEANLIHNKQLHLPLPLHHVSKTERSLLINEAESH